MAASRGKKIYRVAAGYAVSGPDHGLTNGQDLLRNKLSPASI